MSVPRWPCYSVVIPARDASGVIAACLAALARQSIATTGEIIVVDDGSIDDTAKVARSLDVPGLIVLENPARGKSAARNAGLAAARGEIVLFTDADCVPEFDWAERMLEAFGDASVAGARGVYRSRQREIVARFVQAEFEEKYRCLAASQARTGGIEFADTYATAYRRDVLTGLGGFDEAFAGAEDAELSFRVVANGYRLVYVADGIVFHRHPTTARAFLTRKASYAFWRAQVFRRYPDRMARDSYTPGVIPIQMALSLSGVAALAIAPIAGELSGKRGRNLFSGAAAVFF
ncbi:MAG TPA: glycosyltransferase, partial [Chloroflexota bacterium]|nr:glycosyltransferase [Chloroflexota bacterium]